MDQLLVVASTPVPSLINSSSATIATRIKASSSSLHLGSQLRALSGLDQSSSQAATARGLGAGTKAAATKKKKQQQLLLPSLYDHTCASPGYPFHAPLLVPSIMSPCCSSLQPPGAAPQRANVASVEVLAPPEGSADQAPASPKEEGQTPDDNKRIIAPRWRELHGSNDWKGLLQPLDEDLRAEIIRYGEFTEVTYDSFDSNPRSRFCGSNRYRKDKLFDKVHLFNTGYEVTQYIYATSDAKAPFFLKTSTAADPWSKDSNWMGYVAVCTDEEEIKRLGRRDILIAWRGTIMNSEWAANMETNMVPAAMDPRPGTKLGTGGLGVEKGFLSLYITKKPNTRYNQTSAREQVLTELKRLLEKYKGDVMSISITGHSLGAALATLNAYDIAQSGLNRSDPAAGGSGGRTEDIPIPKNWGDATARPVQPSKEETIPIAVFSFAGPKVGNGDFRDHLTNGLGVKVLRLVNVNDIVPRSPGIFLPNYLRIVEDLINKIFFAYTHVGLELKLNNFDSPFLDPSRAHAPNCHNLEGYLHMVAGHQESGPFRIATSPPRDIALVNKSCDFVKDEHFIPDCWWQIENKGLRKNTQGLWVEQERDDEDKPIPLNHTK